MDAALDFLVAESATAYILLPSSLLFSLQLVSSWLTSIHDFDSLSEEIRQLKSSSLANKTKVASLDSKVRTL